MVEGAGWGWSWGDLGVVVGRAVGGHGAGWGWLKGRAVGGHVAIWQEMNRVGMTGWVWMGIREKSHVHYLTRAMVS